MKNIQVIDGAKNTVYDIFSATDEEFALIFPPGEDVAFIEEVFERTARNGQRILNGVLKAIWGRGIPKRDAMGIHGILFCQLEHKKQYYPTRRDEEAMNPDGSRLRAGGSTTL